MDDSELFEDVIAYLQSVKSCYPGGVPRQLISVQDDSETPDYLELAAEPIAFSGPRQAQLMFIAERRDGCSGYAGEEGELLKAAIVKGMRLSGDQVQLVSVAEQYLSQVQLAEEIAVIVGKMQPEIVAVLGEKLSSVITGRDSAEEQCGGSRLEWNSRKLITTHSLAAILRDQQVKKSFWKHLQIIMQECRG